MFASGKTSAASTGGYQISRSLRFNSADTAYLDRTPATATNRRTWTYSVWIKRGKLVADSDWRLFECRPSAYTILDLLNTGSATYPNALRFLDNNGAIVQTTAVYRDPSAWYHIVLAVDTTQATDSNRVKIYVNGIQVTSFTSSTYPTQNLEMQINTANTHDIGRDPAGGGAGYYDGYMTEINLIDGQQLTPSSFGETNAQTGVWQPKAYSGSYGTNGFYLNFSDNSNTTAATLGKDYSGNGNNWTPNNFSVSAGAGNDSLVDSPTSYGTDTGVGGTVRGNYATLNPLAKASAATLSNGNLDAVGTTGWTWAMTTIPVTSGKWYWEVTHTNGGVDNLFCGIAKTTFQNFTYNLNHALSDSYNVYGYTSFSGSKEGQGADTAYGATFQTAGDIVGVALDMDAGTLAFYKNGVSQGQAFSGITVQVCPVWGGASASVSAANMNFGQRPFAYTAPSGFKALCTQNLPTPTIGATTATQAGKYFNTVTYTGTGSSLGVTGVGFQPDWVWVKSRSAATDHGLYDAVRGVQKQLESNNIGAETTETTGITAFNSDGFTTGALAQLNTSAATYVAWNWIANGSGSTNTAGSITSTVSANTTSGFSVVTFTGTNANATIGHGLGVAPAMIIMKVRNAADDSWHVYHKSLTSAAYRLQLNSTAAEDSQPTVWNSTAPTSTVFSVGNNVRSLNQVAYCFAEVAGYSAFGKYTGNGSADGPFVYTGFKPAYVMAKITNDVANWAIHDVARNTYNVVDNTLLADLADAEYTSNGPIDIVANGFKIRTTNSNWNASSYNYIYICFASNPFKYSLAR